MSETDFDAMRTTKCSAVQLTLTALLERDLEPWACEFARPAVAGDPAAAFSLVNATSGRNRGLLAVALWRARIHRDAFQAVLSSAWDHNHRDVIAAAGRRRRLHAMFRYGQFPLPDLPDLVTIWRGTSGLTVSRAVRGLSWTLDRERAVWFAQRHATHYGHPRVLQARVPRSSIAYFSDARKESEVVIFDVGDDVSEAEILNSLHENHTS